MSYQKALQAVSSLPGVSTTEDAERGRIKFSFPGSPLDAFKAVGAALGGKFSLGYWKYEDGRHFMSVTPWREQERERPAQDHGSESSRPFPEGWRRGDRVRVARGRKVPVGTEGVLFWAQERTYRNGPTWKVGVRSDDGMAHWTYLQNLEKVTRSDPRPDENSMELAAMGMEEDPFGWLPQAG